MKRALLLSALLVNGCLHPAQGRFTRDQTVGLAQSAELEVAVADHAAAVRFLGTASDQLTLTLWAGTPSLAFDLKNPASTAVRLTLRVQNTFADAALTADGADVAGVRGDTATERVFSVAIAAGATAHCTLTPPDAAATAAFRFAVLSDIQEAIDKVEDLYRAIDLDPQIRFVVGAGDMTSNGTEEQLVVFQQKMAALQVPYFVTLGNHDIATAALPWYDHFGKASQHFVFKGVSFSLVDDASATIDPEAYAALDGWLLADAGLLKIVAMHMPARDPVGTRDGALASRDEAEKLLALLAKRGVALTLYGHVHSYYAFSNAGIPAFISGGGGAIPERLDGIGRHFLTVDVDPAIGRALVAPVAVDRP